MITRVLRKFLTPLYGKKKYQPLFESLYRMSLTGMNIGGGTNVADSGELNVLHYIRSKSDTHPGQRGATGPTDGPRTVIFDVGANIGDYSLLLHEVFGDAAEIHSFEPSEKTYAELVRNLDGKVKGTRHHFGLGDRENRTSLYSNADGSGLASVYKRKLDHFNIDMNQVEEIEIRTLDGFCKDRGIDHILFLKLDVEGHEKKVLEGAGQMLAAGKIDFIQFEFGGTNIDSRTFFQDFYYILHDHYNIYRIVKDGIYPVQGYGEVYESFLPTNYLAERKGPGPKEGT
jgi:FkbM family methyltransferase